MDSAKVSRIRLQSSKFSRLPVMSPISEEGISPAPQEKNRLSPRHHPPPRSPVQIRQRPKLNSELEDLIGQYMSGSPLKEYSLPHTCPCCKDVNDKNRAKRKEKESLGTFEPLSFDGMSPSEEPPEEDELHSDTQLISSLGLFRSDTTDLIEQQQNQGNVASNINDYTINPHQGSFTHKNSAFLPKKPVYLNHFSGRMEHSDTSARSKLEQDIMKANSKFYKSMGKLHDTVQQL